MSDLPPLERRGFSLRQRLVLILSGIISLILVGQTLMTLSREVAGLDAKINADGQVIAHGVASACATLMEGDDPQRFDLVILRARQVVKLTELVIADRKGIYVGHSDPKKIGTVTEPLRTFRRPRPAPGLADLLRGEVEYVTSAPIVRGTLVLGFVRLRFLSSEVTDRATELIASAAVAAVFWLLVGALAGSIYVRRITRPLAELTKAAVAIGDTRIDDVHLDPPTSFDEVGLLQASFRRLLAALRLARDRNAELLEEQQRLNERLRHRVQAADADLRQTTTYLRAVFRCMKEGVITCDRDGEIVESNEGARIQLRDLGVPAPGRRIDEVIEGGEPLLAAVREAFEGRSSQLQIVRAVPGEDREASERTIAFRIDPLRGRGTQEPLGAVVMVTDETESIQTEKTLRRHERLISLGTMSAGLAHELGNYMNTIHGFSSVVLQTLPDESPVRDDIQAIYDDNRRAVALLGRFLQFARPGQGQLREAQIDELVREAIDICSFRIRAAEVEVVDELGLDDHLVRCDAHQLQQVFVNLVLNAVEAMLDADLRRLVVHSHPLHTGHVEITVSDTGSGISAEHLDRIFDPFFTTKADTGTGLGLSITHQIIDRHGGTISARQHPAGGTTFAIVLAIDGPRDPTGGST